MQHLRDDNGLSGILGYRPPAPETARQWLDRFHDEAVLNYTMPTLPDNVTIEKDGVLPAVHYGGEGGTRTPTPFGT